MGMKTKMKQGGGNGDGKGGHEFDAEYLEFMAELGEVPLLLAVGGLAQRWHLGARGGVGETVGRWRAFLPGAVPLPHPSWRNNAWLKRNPWFAEDLLPALKTRIAERI